MDGLLGAELIEIAGLVITGISGAASVAAVIVALWQVHQEKQSQRRALRRSQAERVSCWFEGGLEGWRPL